MCHLSAVNNKTNKTNLLGPKYFGYGWVPKYQYGLVKEFMFYDLISGHSDTFNFLV